MPGATIRTSRRVALDRGDAQACASVLLLGRHARMGAATHRILVVEDEAIIAMDLAQQLEGFG